MKRKFWLYGCLGVGALALTLFAFQPGVFGQPGANKANKDAVAGTDQVTGLGSISGTVKGPKEFKAAKVYAKNVDKNVTYMVFTEGGKYQAVDLFPGNYEVRAELRMASPARTCRRLRLPLVERPRPISR